MDEMRHQELSEKIIAAAYRAHNELGHGFMERVYKNALAIELGEAGLRCSCEVPLKVLYHGKVVGEYCADMVVEDKIVVEAKALSRLDSIHEVQLVNYLKATGLNVGLLINFGRSVEVKRRVSDSPAKATEA
jgi:GxxExxY protein